MRPFRVWIRPDGDFCHVQVEGKSNALSLLLSLSGSFIFKTFDPMTEREGSLYRFLVPVNPPLTHSSFIKLLASNLEVRLMSGPA